MRTPARSLKTTLSDSQKILNSYELTADYYLPEPKEIDDMCHHRNGMMSWPSNTHDIIKNCIKKNNKFIKLDKFGGYVITKGTKFTINTKSLHGDKVYSIYFEKCDGLTIWLDEYTFEDELEPICKKL